MTENGKAAIYHPNWKPGLCDAKYELRWDQSVWCLTCGQQRRSAVAEGVLYSAPFSEPDGHPNPAPDMSLPANYMAALKAVGACGVKWKMWFGDGDAQCLVVTSPEVSLAYPPADYLAALYDAEHPEEKESNG